MLSECSILVQATLRSTAVNLDQGRRERATGERRERSRERLHREAQAGLRAEHGLRSDQGARRWLRQNAESRGRR